MAKVLINKDVYVRNRHGVLRRVFVGGNEVEKSHVAAIEFEAKRGDLEYFDFEENKPVESPFKVAEVVEAPKVEEPKTDVVEEVKAEEVKAEKLEEVKEEPKEVAPVEEAEKPKVKKK